MRTLSIMGLAVILLVPSSSSRVLLSESTAIELADLHSAQLDVKEETGKIDPPPHRTTCGIASYYNLGGITANGESFNPKALAAAHRSLPFGSVVTVVDQDTGLSVKVRINDRGPWVKEHILDLTPAAIDAIDPKRTLDVRQICMYW